MIELDELTAVAAQLGCSGGHGDALGRATAAMQVVLQHGSSWEPTDEETAAVAVIASAAARFDEGMA
jgi:glycerol dehydrogenase-like iron-containing ADH family enzyme